MPKTVLPRVVAERGLLGARGEVQEELLEVPLEHHPLLTVEHLSITHV